jgi:exodeoxyribonuclease V alpha subunit
MARKQVSFGGTIESILWVDKDSMRALVRMKGFRDSNGELGSSAVVSGLMADLKEGMYVRGKGYITRNKNRDKEFRTRTITAHFPTAPSNILSFLKAGGLPYVSTTDAALKFLFAANDGNPPEQNCQALQKLVESPEAFKMEGFSPTILREMSEALSKESDRITYINRLVAEVGLARDQASRIVDRVPGDPISYLAAHPYETSIVFGVPFKDIDPVGAKLGIIESASPQRIIAATTTVFANDLGHGSTAIGYDTLIDGLTDCFGSREEALSAAKSLQYSHIFQFSSQGDHDRVVQQVKWFELEYKIAKELKRLTEAEPLIKTPDVIDITAPEHQTKEAAYQRDAIKMAIQSNVSIVTGGPGTGKTTTVKTILNMIEDAGKAQGMDVRFTLSAPSGLASKRLTDSTKREATTIHRNLQMTHVKAPLRNRENPLESEVVVIDEGSMLDAELFLSALEAVPTGAKLLIVGDPDQLPSVGAGNVLEDLIKSKNSLIPATTLATVFRNAGPIAHNARAINSGEMPKISGTPNSNQAPGQPWNVWYGKSDQEKKNLIRWLVATEIPQNYGHSASDIQVLSPQHGGELGTESLNKMLQDVINPMGPGKVELYRGPSSKYRTGDKIIYLANTPEKNLVNGDVGFIQTIDTKKSEIIVRFDDQDVALSGKFLRQTKLAYCLSIHKSQGSEYPVAILPMSDSQKWTRQLYYTGVTRGKGHVFTLTDPKTLEKAVSDSQRVVRITGLAAAVNSECERGTEYKVLSKYGERRLVLENEDVKPSAKPTNEPSRVSP